MLCEKSLRKSISECGNFAEHIHFLSVRSLISSKDIPMAHIKRYTVDHIHLSIIAPWERCNKRIVIARIHLNLYNWSCHKFLSNANDSATKRSSSASRLLAYSPSYGALFHSSETWSNFNYYKRQSLPAVRFFIVEIFGSQKWSLHVTCPTTRTHYRQAQEQDLSCDGR